jgi:hypothetical protein
MAVIWTQECGCEITEYGYGRTSGLKHCIHHVAGAHLVHLCQELIAAKDKGRDSDQVISQVRHILDAYSENKIWKLYPVWKKYCMRL